MRPYYEHEGIVIYHGDCRDVVPALPTLQIDMVLTDAPYSRRTHNGARTNRAGDRMKPFIDFDAIDTDELDGILSLCASRLSRWFVSFLDWRHVAHVEANPPAGLRFVRFGIWDKPNGAPQISGDRPAMGWEAIAMLHSTTHRMHCNGGGRRAVWTCLRESQCSHRTQKPLSLVKQLAALFTSPGDVILDPFMGSGTTLRAAKDTGCRAIGIEINERYCEIAANKLRQNVLF